jgi:hypothetical protein
MPALIANLPTGAARDCAGVGGLRTLHDHQRPRDPEVSQARALRPNQLQVCAFQRLASFSRLDDDRHINTCQGVVTGLRKREGNRDTVCVCAVFSPEIRPNASGRRRDERQHTTRGPQTFPFCHVPARAINPDPTAQSPHPTQCTRPLPPSSSSSLWLLALRLSVSRTGTASEQPDFCLL